VKITTTGAKLLSEVLRGCYRVLNRAMWPLDEKRKKALITILDRVDPEARSQHCPAQGALLAADSLLGLIFVVHATV
jgi:hypothetical protein